MMSARRDWLSTALVVVVAVLCLGVAAWLGHGQTFSRPLHADEAGQWSLMVEAKPHSETQDAFHGPALGALARAALAVFGVDPATASEGALRTVPLVFGFTLLFSSFVRSHRSSVLLGLLAIAPCARFIQEPILATSLVWAALFWLREDEVEPQHLWRLRCVTGAAAGLALACKVTAALYLGVVAVSYLWLRRGERSRGGLVIFSVSTVFFWACWQSTFFTDLPALATWWVQFRRAFGLAAGVTQEPLTLVSVWPWVLSTLLLVAAGYGRWRCRAEMPLGRHRLDPLLLASAIVLLVHLLLPYKTPWLLMTVDMLVLIVLLPELIFDDLCRDFDEGTWRVVRGLLLLVVSIGVCRWVADVRYAYLETSAAVPPVARAIRAAATSDSSFVIQVKGTNYWPLPYYLKGLSVGYGDYSGAENASVRLLEASGPDAPRVEGYKITPIELRANEVWWLLVRKDIQLGQ
jgi:hypothetical protein